MMGKNGMSDKISISALHGTAIIIDGCAPILRDCNNSTYWIEGGATCALATVALHDDKRVSTLDTIGRLYRQIKDRDDVIIARQTDDILKVKKEGKFAIVLAFQSSAALDRRVDMVEIYYRLGVRSMNLAYNQAEAAADGCSEPRNGGLTLFGHQVIPEMNRVGMLLDLSHTGHRATMEAMDLSDAPVVFSHSNAKSLYDHPRNLADDQIRRCVERDGVIGLNGHPAFIKADTAAPTLDDYLAHVDTMVDKAGIEHVGIGLDFSHPPGQQMPPARYEQLMTEGVFTPKTLPPPPWRYPIGDARRIMDLTEALAQRGWRQSDLHKLLGENFLRLFHAVWKPED
jgi:membrane dipeptidase